MAALMRRVPLALSLVIAFAACTHLDAPGDPGITAPDPRQLPPVSPVALENAATGTTEWYVPPERRAAPRELSVWASPYSLPAGDTLDVYAHSRHGRVSVSLYRLGWYDGLGGREVFHRDSVVATAQPRCSAVKHDPVICPWTRTTRIPTNRAWTSGIYLLKVTDSSGMAYTYPFVLTDGRVSQFVAVVPQFTWQAYNDFGGAGLYTHNWTPFASFERPYAMNGGAGYLYAHGYSHDLSVLRWLERSGYDVSYVSDLDLSRANVFRAPVKGMLFIGHDEYWTTREYDRVEGLRNAGTHLAFFAANNAYWNVRLEPGPTTGRADGMVVCYKTLASLEHDPAGRDPANNTVRFRDAAINRPENGLYGVMYERFVFGTYSLVAPQRPGPHAEQFLAAAGMHGGDSIPHVIGDAPEGDQIVVNGRTPPGLEIVFSMPYPSHRIRDSEAGWITVPAGAFHTTFFRAASGAGVFAAGSNEWGGHLDDWEAPAEPRIQAVSKAVLDWMLAH